MTRVLIVRGHLANPWELASWAQLPERFAVELLVTRSNRFELPSERLRRVPVRALRDLLPGGPLGEVLTGVAGDRYLSAEEAFARADVVHAEELSFWFAADAARRRERHRFALVQTVWETIPFLATYRNRHARRNRLDVLAHTDLFLPATERAAEALELEGVPAERLRVCPPGIDVERFAVPPPDPPPDEHLLVSPGRLVWEKGHQDVLRALAVLRRRGHAVRLLIVGQGPEEHRLRAYAAELGVADRVELRSVPYAEMPAVFAGASAMVLASLPVANAALHPFDLPRAFWEEQFGLVLAEAMAAGLRIVSTLSGAIPEVLAGTPARLVFPGDWQGIARELEAGALAAPCAERIAYPPAVLERYSTAAMAERLAGAYDGLGRGA